MVIFFYRGGCSLGFMHEHRPNMAAKAFVSQQPRASLAYQEPWLTFLHPDPKPTTL